MFIVYEGYPLQFDYVHAYGTLTVVFEADYILTDGSSNIQLFSFVSFTGQFDSIVVQSDTTCREISVEMVCCRGVGAERVTLEEERTGTGTLSLALADNLAKLETGP